MTRCSRRKPLLFALTIGVAAACGLVAQPALADPAVMAARAASPQRIVSLSPTATEDLFAVGAGKQVVAVEEFSTYPKQAPRTKLSGFKPNAEAIAAYKPDLVIISDNLDNITAQLAKLKIPVLKESVPTKLDGVYTQLAEIGKATGHAAEATALIARLKAKVATIIAATPKPAKPLSAYYELDQTLYSATSKTFIGQVLALLGITNIADKASGAGSFPQLSAEYIIAANPDLIILADTVCCAQNAKTVAARPGWSTIAAVKTGSVTVVDDAVASQWGPRIVQLLQAVSRAVIRLEKLGK